MDKKVLVSELLYFQGAQGHIKLNEKFIKCISSNYSITLLDDGKYFSDVDDSLISERLIIKIHHVSRVERLKAVCHAINLKNIARIAKERGINTVILLSFHTEGFYLARRFFDGIKVIVVHHYEIDRMTKNPKEQKWFNVFKDRLIHCSLEDFISEGLINRFGVPINNVFTINTPVDLVQVKDVEAEANILLGIGQSTDQALIDELILLDKEHYLKADTTGKIILRSKVAPYKGENVEVITGFLEREKYDALYREATACIISYEPTYKLRASGSIDDAFRNHKKVIVMGFPAGKSYAEMYSKNCILVNSAKEIMDYLLVPPQLYDYEDGKKFETLHSFSNVTRQWQRAIEGMK